MPHKLLVSFANLVGRDELVVPPFDFHDSKLEHRGHFLHHELHRERRRGCLFAAAKGPVESSVGLRLDPSRGLCCG